MSRVEFLNQLAEILELPADSLQGGEKLEDMDNWTSLAMVSFIALADEHFGKTLSPRAFAKCETVGDLCDLAGAPA